MKRLTRRGVLATAGAVVIAGPAAAGRHGFTRIGGGAAPITGGTPLITGVAPGTSTGTGSSEAHGFKFTPITDITVTALARWCSPGNSQTHTVSISLGPPGSSQAPVTGASAVVNMAGATPGTFVYAPLSSNVLLFAGQSYFILSSENTGGDTYLNNDTVVTTTADAILNDSAHFFTGLYIVTDGSGVNKPFVPVNFKYNVGSPGQNITKGGSAYPLATLQDSVAKPQLNVNPIISGTVTLSVNWVHGGNPVSGEVITYQWLVDGGVFKSPVLTDGPTAYGLPWVCDTVALGIPDGTHCITARVLDSNMASIFNRNVQSQAIIVHNSAYVNGTQTFWVAPENTNRSYPPLPDQITFTAGNPYPTHATYPMPYTFIAGSNSATLRDPNNWYGERWPGPATGEYLTTPEFVTTPSGGVYVAWFDPLHNNGVTTPAAYNSVVYQNSMDGTRLNTWISPFSTFKEDPAGGGKWWFVEINGRVANITANGTVVTVIGRVRNRSILTLDPYYPGLTEIQMETVIANRGTFPIGVDNIGGANDLCFDPTDANILYVVTQTDNWIARINLSTQTVTVYAGTPGAADGYTGDGGPAASATFAGPSSIIMDGSRNMYVADSGNSAIRKILPPTGTVAGNISTLCGGTVGPTSVSPSAVLGGIAYPVGSGSITWNNGTSTGTVVMQNATTIKLGYTLSLDGATTSGPDPNTQTNHHPRYVVTAFTDNQHFTIGFEQYPGFQPSLPSGAFGGSPVLSTHNSDVYSSPTSVAFASAYVVAPNVIRFTSGGDIVFAEPHTDCIRWVHLGTSTITRIGCNYNYLEQDSGGQWIWIAVDTAGTCGPVDDIIVAKLQDQSGSGAQYTWRMSLAGNSIGQPTYANYAFGQGFGLPTYGPVNEGLGALGHYPWAIEFSTHEGRLVGTGMAQLQACFARIKQSGDPVVDHNTNTNFNTTIAVNGGDRFLFGSASGFPAGIRPSFLALRGDSGCGFITNLAGADTLEDLMATYPTDGALAAYIQAGMGGSVPRPEIVGNDMRDLIYAIRRGTLQGSLGPTPVQPGADDPNNQTPIILTCSAVRNSTTQITVSWTTDIPTLGMAAAWAPGQRALNTVPSLWSDLELSFGTSHSATVQVLAGVSPVHFIVNCESQHGVFAHTIDQTVA